MKDKSKSVGRTSQEIQAELEAMVALKGKAEADLANSRESRKRQREQKRGLQISAYKKDAKALAKRDAINKTLLEMEIEESDYQDTIAELDGQIKNLTALQAKAERMEAADRILSERYPVMQEKAERLDVLFEEAAKIIDELIAVGRLNMADANAVRPGHADVRRFNPTWNLVDALRWRFSMLYPHEALPDAAFRRSLAELTKEGHEAARHTLSQRLREEQAEDSQITKKEVA